MAESMTASFDSPGAATQSGTSDQLCLISGLVAGASGGFLGGVLGLGGGLVRSKGKGMVKKAMLEAKSSAVTFGIMGGIYSTCLCFAKKIRGKDDAINSAFAGCATGLAVAHNAGPAQALQSCAGLGVISFLIDKMNPPPAHAVGVTWAEKHKRHRVPGLARVGWTSTVVGTGKGGAAGDGVGCRGGGELEYLRRGGGGGVLGAWVDQKLGICLKGAC